MFTRVKLIPYLLLPTLLLIRSPAAHAQWAVIDVGAIAQLIQEVQLVQQEVNTAQNELNQARQAYQAITGNRGMQNVLGNVQRNYLPTDLNQLAAVLAGQNQNFAQLSALLQQSINANSILTPAQVAALSGPEQRALIAGRQNAALLQALAGDALATTSNRFASLEQLIAAIPAATDEKGALDLQARIASENAMLANDQSKLEALYRAAQAQTLASAQQSSEQAVADLGSLRALPALAL